MGRLTDRALRRVQDRLRPTLEPDEEILAWDVFRSIAERGQTILLVSGRAIYILTSVGRGPHEVVAPIRLAYEDLLEISFNNRSVSIADLDCRTWYLQIVGRSRGAAEVAQQQMEKAHLVNPPDRPLLRAKCVFYPDHRNHAFMAGSFSSLWAWSDRVVFYPSRTNGRVQYRWDGDAPRVNGWATFEDNEGQRLLIRLDSIYSGDILLDSLDESTLGEWISLLQAKDVTEIRRFRFDPKRYMRENGNI